MNDWRAFLPTSIWRNPIFVMNVRRQLRRKQMIGHGLVMFLITLFVYLIIYLTTTERGMYDHQGAARLAFLWILLIQGFVLMFGGTGDVAAGIATDREKGLIDYQRMTPMSPASKIAGYLFGLPVREYYRFAITLPFMLFSVIMGQFSLLGVIQLYAAFISSVLLYHMTGMVAGMLAKNPRKASRLARTLVIALYLVLPRFADLGITFFEFLRPYAVLSGVLGDELDIGSLSDDADRWRQVGFFNLQLSPTLFTLLVQGTLLYTLYTTVRRKWRHETSHALPKIYALVLFGAVALMVLGNLWTLMASRDGLGVFDNFGDPGDPDTRVVAYVVLFCVQATLMLALAFFLICVVTPDRHHFIKGIRRARKRGLERIPRTDDAASGLWVAGALMAITSLGYLILMATALPQDSFVRGFGPAHYLVPPLAGCATIGFLQVLREYATTRRFWLGIGALWIVPTLIGIVLLSAWSAVLPALYVCVSNPVALFTYCFLWVFLGVMDIAEDGVANGHFLAMTVLGTLVHAAIAGVLWRQLRKRQAADRDASNRDASNRDVSKASSESETTPPASPPADR